MKARIMTPKQARRMREYVQREAKPEQRRLKTYVDRRDTR